jgi:hypothetical protein
MCRGGLNNAISARHWLDPKYHMGVFHIAYRLQLLSNY